MIQETPDPNLALLPFTYCGPATKPDQCDYCRTPENGIYSAGGSYEYPDEIDYTICGKCIVENQKLNRGRFNESDLPELIC